MTRKNYLIYAFTILLLLLLLYDKHQKNQGTFGILVLQFQLPLNVDPPPLIERKKIWRYNLRSDPQSPNYHLWNSQQSNRLRAPYMALRSY